MKLFLGLILCFVAAHCREYHYSAPAVGFHQEDISSNAGQASQTLLPQQTSVIKGNFGPNYEVTMIPSQKIFEQRVQENPQSAVANQNNPQYPNQYTNIQQQPGVLTSANPQNTVNGQQFVNQYSTTNQQQTSLLTQQYSGLVNPSQQPAPVLTSPNPAYLPSAVNGFLQQPNNQYSTSNLQQFPGHNTNLGSSANNQPLLSPPPLAGQLQSSPNPAYYNNNQYSTINPQQSGLITNPYSGLNSNNGVAGPNQPLLNPPAQPNSGYYPNNGNLQQQPVHQYSTINPQQSSLITNQYSGLNSNVVPANAQHHHLNQYSNQQQQRHYQAGAIPTQYQQQQQQQHPYNNNNQNNAPNSNNLLNDLVNNNKYVSQSEASQLDVYPYKQLTIGNTRPFTRFTTKCNNKGGVGQCEQQTPAGNEDFQHQQVLKQSKAKIESISNKCNSNNGNYDYSQNSLNSLNSQNAQNSQISLTDAQLTAKRNLAKKGTELRDRRQFAYTEQVIPQYPHN